jgi:vacuolar-type H+-ATPase subunit F/Vma7
MGTVAAIGDEALVGGFALAGVRVFAAQDPDEVVRVWRDLPDTVELVILSRAAAAALGDAARTTVPPLVAVLP